MRVDEGKPRSRTPVTEQPGLDVVGAQRSGEHRIVLQVDLPDRQVVAGPPPCVDGGEILLTCWAPIRGRGGGFGGRCRGGHACSNGMWVKGKDDPNQCRTPSCRWYESYIPAGELAHDLVEQHSSAWLRGGGRPARPTAARRVSSSE